MALDPKGRSSFTLLQNSRSAESHIQYYAFDILTHRGKNLTSMPLEKRRAILDEVLPRNSHVNLSAVERGSPTKLLKFVKTHGLEGVVAKRLDSAYEPAKRSGLWTKTRINLGQVTVVRMDFLEWTEADHLRHTKFVALREDKDPCKVIKET